MSLHWKFLLHQIVSCFGPISTSLPGEKMPQRKQVNFPVKSDQLENETLKKKNLQSFSIGNYTILSPVD